MSKTEKNKALCTIRKAQRKKWAKAALISVSAMSWRDGALTCPMVNAGRRLGPLRRKNR